MATDPPDVPRREDIHADLERALIEEYLRARGVDPDRLEAMPEAERTGLLREASRHASLKLSEIEARAHYVQDLHDQE